MWEGHSLWGGNGRSFPCVDVQMADALWKLSDCSLLSGVASWLLPFSPGIHTRAAHGAPSALPDAVMVGLWRGNSEKTLEAIRKDGALLRSAGSWMGLGWLGLDTFQGVSRMGWLS